MIVHSAMLVVHGALPHIYGICTMYKVIIDTIYSCVICLQIHQQFIIVSIKHTKTSLSQRP